MGKLIGALLALIVIAGVALAGGWFWLDSGYKAKGPASADGKARVVVIAHGANAQEISEQLEKSGAISNALQMRLALKMHEFMGDKPVMKAGEYEIASGASMEAIVKDLATGSPLQYAVIVPEGLSTSQVLDLLTNKTWTATHGALIYKLAGQPPEDVAEGVLLPGDYAVSRGDTVVSVIDRMKDAQAALLKDAWPKHNFAPIVQQWPKPLDADPIKTAQQAVILASIVEKESGNADEQPKVAAALINRLVTGMKLQADATIVYGITKGTPIGRSLTSKEIDEKTPWNTYAMAGLPETPICNPGAAAIKAVLAPEATKAIYFMADGKGGHMFADNLKEHEANVAAYWKLRKANEKAGVNTPAVKSSLTSAAAPAPASSAPAKPEPAKPTSTKSTPPKTPATPKP